YHRNWTYFAHRFGLDVVGEIEPKPGISPSPAHLAKLIKNMKARKVKLIITAPYFEKKTPQMVASQTGSQLLVLPNMPGGVAGTDGYFQWFDYLIGQLSKAAQKAK
ncbi:MAG: metal ABC transporter substrate-binding protein, partial [Vulcanimicrobiota bacterium]